MDIKELRDKSRVEMERLLTELRNRLREQRFRLASRQLSDVREVRETKKTIARLLTLLKKGADQPAGTAEGGKKAQQG
ncbi:MAG: 50S ribosomal protein L29 [Patescibacteria group bacterium]|nr:50S ribosomal protein L29 [Patescibacteria group bacterium]